MRAARQRRSAAAVVALAVGVAALAAGCGDDDDATVSTTTAQRTTTTAAPTTASATTTTTTTAPATTPAPTTTVASTTTAAPPTIAPTSTLVPVPEGVDPAVAAELQTAVSAYDAAYAAATAAPANPTHPALLDATTDGGLRQGVGEFIGAYATAGQALRPGSDGTVLVNKLLAVEAYDGTQATVTTCYYNGAELYDVASGTVVDASRVTGQNRIQLERGDDGRWRLALAGPISDELTVETNPC